MICQRLFLLESHQCAISVDLPEVTLALSATSEAVSLLEKLLFQLLKKVMACWGQDPTPYEGAGVAVGIPLGVAVEIAIIVSVVDIVQPEVHQEKNERNVKNASRLAW